MSRPKGTQPTPIALFQTLEWMRRHGFRPVPLHYRSKAAVNRDYTDPDYRPPGDELWKRSQLGLGIVTGPPGPVDLDLDCEEAVFFARRFLPATSAVFGRPSKPQSHYLYKVDAEIVDKFALIDPTDGSTIAELRGSRGHQTVMPGSVHQDTGEIIEWSGGLPDEIVTVPLEELRSALRLIGIAVLIARYVWQPGYHNEPTKLISGILWRLNWPLEAAERLIEALMEWSGDADRSRLPTVRVTYRRGEEGHKIAGAGVLRKQLHNDAVVDRLLDWAGSQTVNLMLEYNERFAAVNYEGRFRVADLDVPAGEPPIFYAKDDFINIMQGDTVEIDGKPALKSKLWLASSNRRSYRSVDFLPGGEAPNILNLWSGWAVPASEEGECAAWLELLHEVVCGHDDESYHWLVNWFANILREPDRKSMTAPVMISPEEGAGKNLLIDYFGMILGHGFVTVSNAEHIHGKFNRHIATCLLLHSAEAIWAGDKKHASTTRSLITDQWNILETKGVDAKRIRNYTRIVFTSNDERAVAATRTDRRYSIFHMGDRKVDEQLIRRVLAEQNNGGPARLHHFLAHEYPYDFDVARTNLKNKALSVIKALTLMPAEEWWQEVLMTGVLLPDALHWASKSEKDGDSWPPIVASNALIVSYLHWARSRQIRQAPTSVAFWNTLKQMIAHPLYFGKRRYVNPMLEGVPPDYRNLDEVQNSVLNLPSLERCRKAFEDYVHYSIEWPAELPDEERAPHEDY